MQRFRKAKLSQYVLLQHLPPISRNGAARIAMARWRARFRMHGLKD
jgi:hypothetical protein